jgi:hypothetical protein
MKDHITSHRGRVYERRCYNSVMVWKQVQLDQAS